MYARNVCMKQVAKGLPAAELVAEAASIAISLRHHLTAVPRRPHRDRLHLAAVDDDCVDGWAAAAASSASHPLQPPLLQLSLLYNSPPFASLPPSSPTLSFRPCSLSYPQSLSIVQYLSLLFTLLIPSLVDKFLALTNFRKRFTVWMRKCIYEG